jgi:hypothetical protein
MDFLTNNWYLLFAGGVAVAVVVLAAIKFFHLPSAEQLEKVRQWLLYAVTDAEAYMGGGTGKLKLRWVYDLFVQRFPWLAKVLTFEKFSDLVDDALDEMREMIEANADVRAYVGVEENG